MTFAQQSRFLFLKNRDGHFSRRGGNLRFCGGQCSLLARPIKTHFYFGFFSTWSLLRFRTGHFPQIILRRFLQWLYTTFQMRKRADFPLDRPAVIFRRFVDFLRLPESRFERNDPVLRIVRFFKESGCRMEAFEVLETSVRSAQRTLLWISKKNDKRKIGNPVSWTVQFYGLCRSFPVYIFFTAHKFRVI